MRILITGSRDWEDEQTIWDAINDAQCDIALQTTDPSKLKVCVVHGGARGADMIADACARSLGASLEVHIPDWNRYRKRAGYIRNKEMVDAGADVCLAFIRNNSRGATMTAKLAQNAGIPTRIIRDE